MATKHTIGGVALTCRALELPVNAKKHRVLATYEVALDGGFVIGRINQRENIHTDDGCHEHWLYLSIYDMEWLNESRRHIAGWNGINGKNHAMAWLVERWQNHHRGC
ncbi:MAG: hypothetical protein ACR2PR_11190 [Pseudohongiellaceae bacterium]